MSILSFNHSLISPLISYHTAGDALVMAQTQVLCWEMQNRGESIDLISNPSQAELMQKQFKEKKIALESSKKLSVLEKYGSSSQVMDPRLKLGQTEVRTQ
jgi:pre-mRNA-processing factor SLU7